MRFSSTQRLRSKADFDRARNHGITFHCKGFVFRLLPSLLDFDDASRSDTARRLGVITSKRVGNAVRRNHARRMIREVFRQNQEHLPFQCDLIIVARAAIKDFSLREIASQFHFACRKTRPQFQTTRGG